MKFLTKKACFIQGRPLATEGAVQWRRGLHLDRRPPGPRGESDHGPTIGGGQIQVRVWILASSPVLLQSKRYFSIPIIFVLIQVPGKDAQNQGGLPLSGHVQQALRREKRQLHPDSRVARLNCLQLGHSPQVGRLFPKQVWSLTHFYLCLVT